MKNTKDSHKNNIGIIDSTLREGEQTPGITFTGAIRRTVIDFLHRIGVDELELGVASPLNRNLPVLVKDARNITAGSSTLALWSRCQKEDIDFGGLCRPDLLALSIPASDLHISERLKKSRSWVKSRLAASIDQALALNIPAVSVGFEDASRADPDFLLILAKIAEKCGACRIRLADTVGTCTPAAIKKLLYPLKNSLKIDIGVHCHNDFGMATANSITALQSGARWLDATVLGLGERAGNCRLEEVIGFLALNQRNSRYHPELLFELCSYIAETGKITIPVNHPIVGTNIFTCETGLHQHGLSVNPATYEPYDPQRVGIRRKLRFGRKTGKRAIHLELARQGIHLNDHQIGYVAAWVRSNDAPLSPEQLHQFAIELIRENVRQ